MIYVGGQLLRDAAAFFRGKQMSTSESESEEDGPGIGSGSDRLSGTPVPMPVPSPTRLSLTMPVRSGSGSDSDSDEEVEDTGAPMAKRPRLDQLHEKKEAAVDRAADDLKEQGRALLRSAEQRAKYVLATAATKKAVIDKWAENKIAETEKWVDDKRAEFEEWETDKKAETEQLAADEKAEWEAEKETFANVQQFEPIIKLNVGGVRFETSRTSLCRFPESKIGRMFSGRHALPQGEDGYFFIDRDGRHFHHILNFLRSPEGYKVPPGSVGVAGAEVEALREECKYYGLVHLMFPDTHPSSANLSIVPHTVLANPGVSRELQRVVRKLADAKAAVELLAEASEDSKDSSDSSDSGDDTSSDSNDDDTGHVSDSNDAGTDS